jgi:hypothetical protein
MVAMKVGIYCCFVNFKNTNNNVCVPPSVTAKLSMTDVIGDRDEENMSSSGSDEESDWARPK